MATNVYAPSSCDLANWGFRWCNKDQRWERRKSMSDGDSRVLAAQTGYKVEVTHPDGTTFIHTPTSEDPVSVSEPMRDGDSVVGIKTTLLHPKED